MSIEKELNINKIKVLASIQVSPEHQSSITGRQKYMHLFYPSHQIFLFIFTWLRWFFPQVCYLHEHTLLSFVILSFMLSKIDKSVTFWSYYCCIFFYMAFYIFYRIICYYLYFIRSLVYLFTAEWGLLGGCLLYFYFFYSCYCFHFSMIYLRLSYYYLLWNNYSCFFLCSSYIALFFS